MQGPKKRSFSVEEAVEDGSSLQTMTSETMTRETSVISRKQLAREMRRAAYQRAKLARAADPRHQAMKEAAKLRRREMYQQVKERRKAREAELETKEKAAATAARESARHELAERVRGAIQGSRPAERGRSAAGIATQALVHRDATHIDPFKEGHQSPVQAGGHTLARDIERALQCADVKELLDRLRRESPALASRHQETRHQETRLQDAGHPEDGVE